jgi:predicted N-acyltransferase
VSLQCQVYESIAGIDQEEWRRICRQGGGTVFMDPRFLGAAERSLSGQSRFWHVVVSRERDGEAVACASLSTFRLDLSLLADPSLKRLLAGCRKLRPSLARPKILFCGIPVSVGRNQLAMVADDDPSTVVQAIDSVMEEIAGREKVDFLIFKEFSEAESGALGVLARLGYSRAESPVRHIFPSGFTTFPDYCHALKSHYRNDIRRSQKKFQAAGLRVVHLRGELAIGPIYTSEVHRLYRAVVEGAESVLEILPVEFFHELLRRFDEQISLTVIFRDEEIVAFNWALLDGSNSYFLFCGIDYGLNSECDLYFNLMYLSTDDAMRSGATRISVGQTSDSFRARLGCEHEKLFFFVKPRKRAGRIIVRNLIHVLVPDRPPIRSHDVFNQIQARSAGKSRPSGETESDRPPPPLPIGTSD